MGNTYYIPYGADVYEVVVRETIIMRITKIIGDSQIRMDINYDDLTLEARWTINDYLENLNNHE